MQKLALGRLRKNLIQKQMHRSNTTKAQHFLSRTEQSLNALNPAASLDNQRIYSFTVIDREAYRVQLDDAKGRKISSNLAIHDLFSFDVIGYSPQRLNFEAFFGQYEASVKTSTIELLRKLRSDSSDIKKEVLELFVAKLVNFLRNPYSVKKVLNTIGGLLNFRPTDPELLDKYNAVLAGKKPHQEYLCRELGIDAGEYQAWLSTLFMALFRPRPDEMNLNREGCIRKPVRLSSRICQSVRRRTCRKRLFAIRSRIFNSYF